MEKRVPHTNAKDGLQRSFSESTVWDFLDATVDRHFREKRPLMDGKVTRQLHKRKKEFDDFPRRNENAETNHVLRPELPKAIQISETPKASNGLSRSQSGTLGMDSGGSATSITYREQRSYVTETNSTGDEQGIYSADYHNEATDVDESEDEDTQMKSIHELRFAGEKQRIMDEIEYLIDGISSKSNSANSRYNSFMEICEQIYQRMFRTCLKSSQDLQQRIFSEVLPEDKLQTILQIYIFSSMADENDFVQSLLENCSKDISKLFRSAITEHDQRPIRALIGTYSKTIQSSFQELFNYPSPLTKEFSNEPLLSCNLLSLVAIALMKACDGPFSGHDLFLYLLKLEVEHAITFLLENGTQQTFLLFSIAATLDKAETYTWDDDVLEKLYDLLSFLLKNLLKDSEQMRNMETGDSMHFLMIACCEKLLRTLIRSVNSDSSSVSTLCNSELPKKLFEVLNNSVFVKSRSTEELVMMSLGLLLEISEESEQFVKTLPNFQVNTTQTMLDVLLQFYKEQKPKVELSGYAAMLLIHCIVADPRAFDQIVPMAPQLKTTLIEFKQFHINLKEELMLFGTQGLAIVSIVDDTLESLEKTLT
ncbi:wings apart-like Wapl [Schizosaccharomyces cryophilus OY26]|uniref:Wings apart-like Wapl n=1 Tax=Schizosaccharomyces cryophilus (strain OY26 / ATCC MYA-4695 / CBS 11777 / NBRC 106824 / NRRL Y48691) TaxID=653667 RepID=S9X1X7_SCHCR|nr:wings apart-like Wapl [Schizosaccharomyces cryophilus OY26]EPY51112.1 wings apart-like Wapl [Schizosaccharomyces cryophilus OY26]